MSPADVIVVGSGPNGLSAAVVIPQAGLSVQVVQAAATIGGGTRTEQLTLPGLAHDDCSAVHPFGAASPFCRRLRCKRTASSGSSRQWRWLIRSIAIHPHCSIGASRQRRVRSVMTSDDIVVLWNRWEDLAADAIGPLLRPSR